MTTFGKILVFLNLAFALFVGALIGMVYLTRTNWKTSFDKLNAAVTAEVAKHQQDLVDKDRLVQERDKQAQIAIQERDDLKKKNTSLDAELRSTKDLLEGAKRATNQDINTTTTVTTEIERRRIEVQQLQAILKGRDDRIKNLEEQLTKMRDEAVTYQLQYKTLKEKNDNLTQQYEDASRELAGLRARGVTAGTSRNVPPPEQVRGTVKAIDGNLATISIGTDAGVNKDNVLYLYRLTPTPEYLGELTILSATPFEAVGRVKTAKRLTVIKPGDEVASRITIQK